MAGSSKISVLLAGACALAALRGTAFVAFPSGDVSAPQAPALRSSFSGAASTASGRAHREEGSVWAGIAVSAAVSLSLAGASLQRNKRETNLHMKADQQKVVTVDGRPWDGRGLNRGHGRSDGPPRMTWKFRRPDFVDDEDDVSEIGSPHPYDSLKLDPAEARKKDPSCKRPDWMTVKKWETFPLVLKCRSEWYWTMIHDETGTYDAYPAEEGQTVEKAVDKLKTMLERSPPPNIDPDVRILVNMNIDPKFPDQQVRLVLELPHGSGKSVRVAVFCNDDEEAEAMECGAAVAGSTLSKMIEERNLDFDMLIAKPQMMPRLAKLGKILGPAKLMPSPKAGTVVTDWKAGIDKFGAGSTIEVRNSKMGSVHMPIGKMSWDRAKICENAHAIVNGLAERAPSGIKNPMFKAVFIMFHESPNMLVDAEHYPLVDEKKEQNS